MHSTVSRGAAQVVERGAQAVARGGARCASRVLDRGVPAAPLVGFLQVLDRGAQVVAAAATLSQPEKANLLMCSGKEHFSRVLRRIIRVRVIMTSANCCPAVASRRENMLTTSRFQRSKPLTAAELVVRRRYLIVALDRFPRRRAGS